MGIPAFFFALGRLVAGAQKSFLEGFHAACRGRFWQEISRLGLILVKFPSTL